MRVLTLLSLFITLLVFGGYYYLIEPLIEDQRWLNFLVFMSIFMSLTYVHKKVDGANFEFLQKRIDKQLSLLIVIFSLVVFIVVGMWF